MKYTIPAKKMVSEKNPISLIVDNKNQAAGETTGFLGFSWLFYYPLLVLTCGLLMPQTREYFTMSGWRWVYVMTL
ncbi:MAG: hypothetical protein PVF56_21640, partial [Desulfobacterales bacterium]